MNPKLMQAGGIGLWRQDPK